MSQAAEKPERDGVLPRVATCALVVGLLAAGVGAFAYLVVTKPRPAGEPPADPGRLVRAFIVRSGPHRVAVTAYGTSRAGTEWTAIAEVAGRVVEVAEHFDAGNFLLSGTILVRIDPTDYELARRRYAAEVRSGQERLRELAQQESNLKETLALRERQLQIAQRELERIRDLFEAGQETQTALDAAENARVQQRAAVQELRNQLALIPSQRGRQEATLELAQAGLEEAEAKLAKTEVKLPLGARCASRAVELDQYVGVGATLGTFYSIDKAEVVAMLEVRKLKALLAGRRSVELPVDLEHAEEIMREHFRLPAQVRWAIGGHFQAAWRGTVVRMEAALDPRTRCTRLIVEVPAPYEGVIPGVRPPLLPGVFCEVTLYGEVVPDAIVLPRDCVRDNRVYLIRDGRLHITRVDPLVTEDNQAIIRAGVDETGHGLADGDVVVLADLFPAVADMKLRPELVDNPAHHRPPDLPESDSAPPAATSRPGRVIGWRCPGSSVLHAV